MESDLQPDGSSLRAEPGSRDGSRRLGWGLAAAILLVAAALRFWALDFGLPHLLARPDETPVIEHSTAPSRGDFALSWAVYPNSYVYACWLWGEGALRVGRALGTLTPADYTRWLREQPESLYVVQRSASALAGVAAVALLMALTRRELGGRAALVAGLLLATNFLHVRDSHGVKPDVPLSLAVVGALWAMLPLARGANLGRALGAGAAVGLAMACKYTAVLMLVPLYAAAWMGAVERGWRRFVSGPALAAGVAAGAVFLATSPLLIFNSGALDMVNTTLKVVFPALAESLPARELLLPSSSEPWGPDSQSYRNPAWWGSAAYHFSFSLRHGSGLLFAVLAPLGVGWALWSRRTLPTLAATAALSFFAVFCASPIVLARYMTPLSPLLALCTAGMLTAGATALGRSRGRPAADLLLAVGCAAVVAQPLASSIAHYRIASRLDTRAQAWHWFQANARPGDGVVTLGTRFWSWGAPRLPGGLVSIRAVETTAELRSSGARYVVTHDHPLFWSSLDPDVLATLAPELELREAFDPGPGVGRNAIFEVPDAYYVPFAGFRGVERGGPRIAIYEVRQAH